MSETPHINNIFSAEEEDCLSLAQMQGYREGKLSADEKHYAERHLLNCELCAMAYEGVIGEDAETIEEGAAAIAAAAWQRVGEKEKKRRLGAWIWISAAASVMLIIAVGIVVMRNPQEKIPLDQIAENYYEQPAAPTDEQTDSSTLEESGAIASAKEPSKDEKKANKPQKMDVEQDALVDGTLARSEDPVPPPPMLAEVEPLEDAEMAAEEEVALNDEFDITSYGNADPARSKVEQQNELKKDGNSLGNTSTGGSNMPAKDKSLEGFNANSGNRFNYELDGAGGDNDQLADGKTSSDFSYAEANDMDDANVVELEEEVSEPISPGSESKPVEVTAPVSSKEIANMQTISAQDIEKTTTTASRSTSTSKGRRKRDQRDRHKNRAGKSSGQFSKAKSEAKPDVASGEIQEKPENGPLGSSYERGMDSYRNGEFSQSAVQLREASSETPTNLQAHFYAAASFLNIEQPRAAIFHLDRVLKVPGNSLYEDAEWFKAIAYLKLHEEENARTLLEKISKGDGKHANSAKKALDDL